MTLAVVVGVVMWLGTPLAPLMVVAAALHHPVPALVILAGWIAVRRTRAGTGAAPEEEAKALDRLVAELEGGASPRSALVRGSRANAGVDLIAAGRLAAAGIPAEDIATELRDAFPLNGRLVGAAWALAAESGAPASIVIGLLARRAAERGRLQRERRALTAQARATAWLIGGVPLAVCLGLIVTGRIGAGPELPVVLAGVVLQLIGIAVVVVMIRRDS